MVPSPRLSIGAIRNIAVAFAIAVPSTSHGQTVPHRALAQPRVASVSGDVYLVVETGDVRRIAANAVFLVLQDSASAALAHCKAARQADDSLSALLDSLEKLRLNTTTPGDAYRSIGPREDTARLMRDELERRVAKAVRLTALAGEVQVAHTDVNGHYAFAGVKPGPYALWAETSIGDHVYTWLKPVTVAPGTSLRQDLDNTSVNGVYCGFVVQAWWLR